MDAIIKRQVDDPMITPAELEARRRRVLERGGLKRGEIAPGKVEAEVRLVTLIGGLARLPTSKCTEERILAAARYRGLWERAQLGGARAVDYGALRVDTSGGAIDLVLEIGERARAEYVAATQRLGMIGSSLVDRVVLHDMSLRAVARRMGEGEGGAARGRVEGRLLAGIDLLVEHFGYGAGRGPERGRVRADGEAPSRWQGEDRVAPFAVGAPRRRR